MSKAYSGFFLPVVFFLLGVQVCQIGLVPKLTTDYSYELTSSESEAEAYLKSSPGAVERLQVNKPDIDAENTEFQEENHNLKVENLNLKNEIALIKQSLAEAVQSKENVITNGAVASPSEGAKDDDTTLFHIYDNGHCDGYPQKSIPVTGSERILVELKECPKSIRVQGGGMAEPFYFASYHKDYKEGILMEHDGCYSVPQDQKQTFSQYYLYSASATAFRQRSPIPKSLQQKFATAPDVSKPHTRFVFSVTCSHYFGYQVLANAYAFLNSNQTNASWLRLMTSRVQDDLSERFPTFSAPRTLHSRTYTPVNKPDVITKWFLSKDAPHPDDTIIVIDPDSWLLLDMEPWTRGVTQGVALAQEAYYVGRAVVNEMWQELCLENCQKRMDLVGVPYILKASDLEKVAPLWSKYTVILKRRLTQNSFHKKYGNNGFDWAAEMIGFNAACAHLNITTSMTKELQVRDIESPHKPVEKFRKCPTIHVGRAWFPVEEEQMAAPWRSADHGGFGGKTRIQVWCKCNRTSAEIQPWPIPTKNMDFASKHTLTILHESQQFFGPVPANITFRDPSDYYNCP